MKKSILFGALFFLIAQFGYSQIKSVDYSLRYNSESCLFDCYLIVNEGKAKSTISRAQFNSQISIVVPVTSFVFVVESFMPLKDNQTFRSAEPTSWEITNELEQPVGLEDSRIVSISPILAPAAFYDELEEGDEIKLFSFKVNPITNCADGVRLYDNQKDPKSNANGMVGADFRNGFTIGGVQQKYAGNAPNVMPTPPVFVSTNTKNGSGLNFEASNPKGSLCQQSLTYEFFGPKGKIGDLDAYLKLVRKQQDHGEYRVVAIDEIGCSSEFKFLPFGKLESEVTLIGEEDSDNNFDEVFQSSIYPNPAQDIINLTVSGKKGSHVIGEFYDLDGKLVKSSVANFMLSGSEESIKIETGLAPGIYNLALNIDENEVVNHKVIIIK